MPLGPWKRHSALAYFFEKFPRYRPYLPALVALGVLGAIAETLGLSLVALLLNSMIGQSGAGMGQVGGLLGTVYKSALHLVGGRTVLLAGLVLLLIIAKSLTNLVYALVTSWWRHALSEDVRNTLHSDYLHVSYEQIRAHDTGQLFNILSADSWAVADAGYVATRIATNACSALIFSVFLFAVSFRLALIAVVGALFIFLLMGLFGRRAEALGGEAVKINIALMDRMLAGMQGMRTLRAFGQEDLEKDKFRRISGRARRAFMAIDRLQATISPVSEISHLLLLAGVVAASGPLGVSVPATMTVVLLLYRVQPPLRELQGNILALVGHRASLSQARSILDMPEKSYPPLGHLPFSGLKNAIRFENVSFTYAGHEESAIENLTMEIPARGVTAIAGPSGSGKTTLIGLLLRLYQPTVGRILADGVLLDNVARADWLSRTALAGQDADLISGTIAENIRLGRLSATLDDVREAAALSGIAEFIDELPEGYETNVGERGLNLSGGQRQRVGLARAVLREPDLLILDEATNALEDQMERAIHERLRARFADRAIVIITHRVTGLPPADQVITLTPPAHSQQHNLCPSPSALD